jgi:hypothetical protein
MTLRDSVWDAVLRKLAIVDEAGFKISDLDFDESQRHTVRRVLREMEDLEWLERTNERGRIWYPGESAKQFLKLSKEDELVDTENPN